MDEKAPLYSARRASGGGERPIGEERIAAEVVPTHPQHAGRTAKALQERGFRVLHVGRSISVEASQRTWEDTFGVSFAPHTKSVQEGLGRRLAYLRADPASMRVPADLQELVADVAFAEPPELY